MKVIYIAGPFRAKDAWLIEQNVRSAEAMALEVWRAGAAAVCPHANTRFYQGAAPDEVWLAGDMEILSRCDAILVCPGWANSSGTVGEMIRAIKLKIPVFMDLDDLKGWLTE